jgi:hypothetical protein
MVPTMKTLSDKAKLENRIARLRSAIIRTVDGSPEEKTISAELTAALAELKALPDEALRGPYSGLTRSELCQSRTCETDWY